MMKKYCFLLLLLLVNGLSYSQTYIQMVDFADEKMIERDYLEAMYYYEKAMKIDSNSVEILWKMAEVNRFNKDYQKAEYYYQKVYDREKAKIYKLSIFWLASMQHYNGKYQLSMRHWRLAKKVYKRNRKGYHYLKSTQEFRSCLWAKRVFGDTAKLNVSPIGDPIGSKDAELAPVIYNNKLIYTALKADSITDNQTVLSEDYHFQLFESTIFNRTFSKSTLLKNSKLNGYHVANGTFSEDGKRFYFSRCDDDYNCKIFVGTISKGKIINVDSLGDIINDDNKRTTMPHIAMVDGKEILFYASDREDGYGGLDIWCSEIKDKNQFSKPRNLGRRINTPDDDISPFYDSKNEQLYFSSSWHSGFGGHDIFSAKKMYGRVQFSVPLNMGIPINSAQNDTYFIIDKKQGDYYFSSNRIGVAYAKNPTCCNDIFLVQNEIESEEELKKLERFSSLEDLNKKLPVTLYFHNDRPNPKTNDTTSTIDYMVSYNRYLDLKTKYKKEYSKGLVGDDSEEAKEDIEDFFVEFIEQGIVDLDIFCRLLIKELNKGNDLVIVIKGFASPLAKSDYNVNLTKRRINSLVKYLLIKDNGIFKPFIESGALSFEAVPFGEYTADKFVSDNVKDKKNSIYNRKAAIERKIEIQSVQINNNFQQSFEFNKQVHDFGIIENKNIQTAEFTIKNTSDTLLIVKELINECPCIQSQINTKTILPGESQIIKVEFNPENQKGLIVRRVLVVFEGDVLSKEIAVTVEVK